MKKIFCTEKSWNEKDRKKKKSEVCTMHITTMPVPLQISPFKQKWCGINRVTPKNAVFLHYLVVTADAADAVEWCTKKCGFTF